ncbi:hypothetical protein L226DRAFT_323303 [Lentinus tigrinus ALCF2SS1-7]|uniref:uncharacterized protein n=1 Tax=Lentinus tigrinus ALCF2SS1-7 TaxID=1328758 RepID=UPI001165D445|nr:hypothetical protein L226DRAFT_323303 [Lentinus tigrinus ALCF2SS1-7]
MDIVSSMTRGSGPCAYSLKGSLHSLSVYRTDPLSSIVTPPTETSRMHPYRGRARGTAAVPLEGPSSCTLREGLCRTNHSRDPTKPLSLADVYSNSSARTATILYCHTEVDEPVFRMFYTGLRT